MKKTFLLLATVALMLMVVSCKKESINEPEIKYAKNVFYCRIVNDSKDNAPQRIFGDMSPMTHMDGYYTVWNDSDQITINGYKFKVLTKDTTISNEFWETRFYSDSLPLNYESYKVYHAFYPATIQPDTSIHTAVGTLPASYQYDPNNLKTPMYGYGTGNSIEFHNICAILRLVIPAGIKSITVSAKDYSLHGSFTIDSTATGKFYAKMNAVGSHGADTVLTINPNSGTFNTSSFVYVPIPVYSYKTKSDSIDNLTITLTKSDNSTIVKRMSKFRPQVNTIYSGNFAEETFMNKRFSICCNKKVYFTKGNLYYNSGFCFEDNQGAYTSPRDNDHISYFYFCEGISDATSSSHTYDNTKDTMLFCYKGNTGFSVNGLYGLFALSIEDWDYLMHRHNVKDSKIKAAEPIKREIDSKKYLILAPDGVLTIPTNYSIEQYTDASFLVLPLTGYYNGSSVQSETRYWVGDVCKTNRYYFKIDNDLTFNSNSDTIQYSQDDFACAIRLARIAQ